MKKPGGKGGDKAPTSGDDDVWWHTAASVEPLKRGKPRFHPAVESAKAKAESPSPKAASPRKKISKASDGPIAQPATAQRTKSASSSPPALSTFDRNSMRKIKDGRMEIEARVDLHGMRQDEAHTALRAFLMRCHGRGMRFVLVITGKGRSPASGDIIADYEGGRGILRRNVPRWLEEPDVRNIVVSYTTAAIRHGGEGALYIHLRSSRRS
jgi:DNA-nicking Smr family endonuclease